MNIAESIHMALAEYHADWRHPRLEPFKFSGLYALHPEEPATIPVAGAWPSTWPNNGRAGVYLIFGTEMQLSYVGKTVDFGWRLSQHFKWSEGRGKGICQPQGTWKIRPMFVATLPVSERFEAAGLEEYLIVKLRPPDNSIGKARA
jgi:hypothetical protein